MISNQEKTEKEFSQHFGVYAIIWQNDALLLTQQALGFYKGLWDLPGGRQDDWETLEESLIREVKEETGYTLEHCKQIVTNEAHHKFRDKETGAEKTCRHIGILYSGNVCGTPLTQGNDADSAGLIWLTPKNRNTITLTPHAQWAWENVCSI